MIGFFVLSPLLNVYFIITILVVNNTPHLLFHQQIFFPPHRVVFT